MKVLIDRKGKEVTTSHPYYFKLMRYVEKVFPELEGSIQLNLEELLSKCGWKLRGGENCEEGSVSYLWE